MKQFLNLFFLFIISVASAQAQSIVGKWKTIDDETGKPKSVVEIFEKNGKIYGKIIQLFREPGEDPDPICDKCTDDRKNKKVIGMEIIRELVQSGKEWKNGNIMDPKNGTVYDAKLWLEDGKLKVRGYVLFLYRTQTWLPYKE